VPAEQEICVGLPLHKWAHVLHCQRRVGGHVKGHCLKDTSQGDSNFTSPESAMAQNAARGALLSLMLLPAAPRSVTLATRHRCCFLMLWCQQLLLFLLAQRLLLLTILTQCQSRMLETLLARHCHSLAKILLSTLR
jgi:hypothetical protein